MKPIKFVYINITCILHAQTVSQPHAHVHSCRYILVLTYNTLAKLLTEFALACMHGGSKLHHQPVVIEIKYFGYCLGCKSGCMHELMLAFYLKREKVVISTQIFKSIVHEHHAELNRIVRPHRRGCVTTNMQQPLYT